MHAICHKSLKRKCIYLFFVISVWELCQLIILTNEQSAQAINESLGK